MVEGDLKNGQKKDHMVCAPSQTDEKSGTQGEYNNKA